MGKIPSHSGPPYLLFHRHISVSLLLVIFVHTHCVVSPRVDYARQVGARVKEEVVAPLLVTDVQGVAVDIDSENETDDT